MHELGKRFKRANFAIIEMNFYATHLYRQQVPKFMQLLEKYQRILLKIYFRIVRLFACYYGKIDV